VLDFFSNSYSDTVWIDHYAAPEATGPGPTLLYAEVELRHLKYQLGGYDGICVVVKIAKVTIIQHTLARDMSRTRVTWEYVGLSEKDLFVLLNRDVPWIDKLPSGRCGVDRTRDRRPPRNIE
jgi:hypothetical protein